MQVPRNNSKPASPFHSGRSRGVSFIELTVTMLIMGVAAAVAVPRYSTSLARYRVEAAAKQIVSDLNSTRATARRTSSNCTAAMISEPAGYTLSGVSPLDQSGTQRDVALNDYGYEVSLTNIDFNNTTSITWDLYGLPWAGDPLAPLYSGSMTVASGGITQTITIDTATGKASMP